MVVKKPDNIKISLINYKLFKSVDVVVEPYECLT